MSTEKENKGLFSMIEIDKKKNIFQHQNQLMSSFSYETRQFSSRQILEFEVDGSRNRTIDR